MTRVAAVILVFAEAVSVRVSSKSVLQECQVRVSEKKYQARVSYKSVK